MPITLHAVIILSHLKSKYFLRRDKRFCWINHGLFMGYFSMLWAPSVEVYPYWDVYLVLSKWILGYPWYLVSGLIITPIFI